MNGYGEAIAKLDAFGIDAICDGIGNGDSMTAIARNIGVSIGSLLVWTDATPERSARAREARSVMSSHWDEKSEQIVASAADEFEFKKAKELAHHYRWRSAKIDPKRYGDRIAQELSGPDGGPIDFRANLSDDELLERVRVLNEQLGIGKPV